MSHELTLQLLAAAVAKQDQAFVNAARLDIDVVIEKTKSVIAAAEAELQELAKLKSLLGSGR